MPAQPVAQIGIPTRPFDVEAAAGFPISRRLCEKWESSEVRNPKVGRRILGSNREGHASVAPPMIGART
jgi:hypothetical protein